MSIEFLKTDFDKVSYLANILTARATGMASDSSEYEALRKDLLSNPAIALYLPPLVRQHRNLDSFWGFIQPKFSTYAERRTYISEHFTKLLDALELGSPIQSSPAAPMLTAPPQSNPVLQQMPATRNKRKVFIVHGRDNGAKQEVGRFIESLGLEAIILHEKASSGMTIIEKIEHYSNDADFALVLYTACDKGRGAHETKIPARDRARQNVVFEHGYLMAKLGRKNVCSLVKGQIETPNDISGVVYVPLDDFGAWKKEVAKELKACGYSIGSVF
ncbi:Predicted nucleotide-binding protein containing TIR-like domain-containing protein [Ferrimonas sediminum]|uniref:Predicted nucleotide-binding protein containing TIR-like domain-containing protein n=1 Tax=Ferrimonas sediminum TaxID=718193 RepID=A0A1G8TWR8_9GAMM|nr:nucleotide-binding protein [Ferrimonas sediminum]SDJ46008.1 Predicted nucleotide-binding protein containing TIR-like domain-containing protein [Ferrimonas sediminum]